MHLKRLRAPKNWPLLRKEMKFTARPLPGPHAIDRCITLNLVLRSLLNYAKTKKEINEILNKKGILIDKKKIKDYRYPLGVMDVLEIPSINEVFRIVYGKDGKFLLKKISKENSKSKICRIIGKKILGKDKIQINLYDGKNVIVKKDEYGVGDSLLVNLENLKVEEHYKLEKGAKVYVVSGNYTGEVGIVEEIIKKPMEKARIVIKSTENKFETLRDYAFVVDKEFKI